MDEWLTTAEAAQRIKVTDQTIRRWIQRGELRGVLLADKAGYRIRANDLQELMERREREQLGERRAQ